MMKLKRMNQLHIQHPERQILGLHPLLKKGGVHREDDVTAARQAERRQQRQQLRKTDWLVRRERD